MGAPRGHLATGFSPPPATPRPGAALGQWPANAFDSASAHKIGQVPPDTMTPEQRRYKIAALLTNGPGRMRSDSAQVWLHSPGRTIETLPPG